MKNIKILEMINNRQIEDLKSLIQEEIYTKSLTEVPGAKNRYKAMQKYFKLYNNNSREFCTKPAQVTYNGKLYTAFVNGYSIVLTTESAGNMELYKKHDYFDVESYINNNLYGDGKELNLNKIFAGAKSKGYKLLKKEFTEGKYFLHYENNYYKLALIDTAYSIINNGEKVIIYHSNRNVAKPIIIKNNIGIVLICPINSDYMEKNSNKLEIIKV